MHARAHRCRRATPGGTEWLRQVTLRPRSVDDRGALRGAAFCFGPRGDITAPPSGARAARRWTAASQSRSYAVGRHMTKAQVDDLGLRMVGGRNRAATFTL